LRRNFSSSVTLGLLACDHLTRLPSAAARDQHSSCEVRDHLSSMLSRRQLQGFVMLRCSIIRTRFHIFSLANTTIQKKAE